MIYFGPFFSVPTLLALCDVFNLPRGQSAGVSTRHHRLSGIEQLTHLSGAAKNLQFSIPGRVGRVENI